MSGCSPVYCIPKTLSQGFVYYFNSGTTDADPGSGALRYNEIVQADTTEIYINYTTASGADILNFIQNIAISTNPILGQAYVLKSDNSGKGQVFNVTAITTHTDYAKLDVVLVNDLNGPDALVFGDYVIFSFVQAGDAGTPGGPQGFQGVTGAQGFQGTAGAAGGASAPNNVTNNSFVGSGQTPALAGASAGNLQSSSCIFGTTAMLFMVTLTNESNSILCQAGYASSAISAISDPGNFFRSSDSGIGIYISKASNSFSMSFKNRTGASNVILVQAINAPITSATAWS